jgi:integrase
MPKYKRGGGSIYKRGRSWWIKHYVDSKPVYEPARGTGPRERAKDRTEARQFLESRRGQVAEGRYVGRKADRVTFDELAASVVNDYKTNGKKTLADLERRIVLHLQPVFGGRRAHMISTADVQAFIAKRKSEDASNGEINRELAVLRRGFRLGLQSERIVRMPHVPRLAERNVRQGFFERHEFETLLAKLPAELRALVTFAYWTGWRWRSEIASLTWAQVDLEEGTVRLEPESTKNREARLIFLPAPARAVVQEQWSQRQAFASECRYVFHRDGEPIRDFRGAWEKACAKAGLTGKVPHDFRRTAVRNMVRAGIPERVAMVMSGHRTRDVFVRYNIVSESDLREAAKRLGDAFAGRTVTNSVTKVEDVAGEPQEKPLTH